jgi:hypothetical protein
MYSAFVRSKIERTSMDPFSEGLILAQGVSDASAYCYGLDSPFVAVMVAPFVLKEERRVPEVFD